MGGFFNLDGPFARFGNMLADVLILSMLWLVFSIPVITSGAATTALFYVATRRVSDKEGYIFRDFWKSFRANFRQATVCWLIMLFLAFIVYINISNIGVLGGAGSFVLPVQICIAFEMLIIALYVFPLLSRFEMTVPGAFKTAFFMANRHLPTTLALMLTGAGVLALSAVTILFSFAAAGAYAFAASYLLVRVFRKYRPEMDRDGEPD